MLGWLKRWVNGHQYSSGHAAGAGVLSPEVLGNDPELLEPERFHTHQTSACAGMGKDFIVERCIFLTRVTPRALGVGGYANRRKATLLR